LQELYQLFLIPKFYEKKQEDVGMDESVDDLKSVIGFLEENDLFLTTAESCTAGLQVSMLADFPGCGAVLESGFVVYSARAKQSTLGVQESTIKNFGLTSEEVAREMASGALLKGSADIAIANTGKANSDDELDGVVCFSCALRCGKEIILLSETKHFCGERNEVRKAAACYGLLQLPEYYAQLKAMAKPAADIPAQ
jgi:nicotinamide-nucleotide amidase